MGGPKGEGKSTLLKLIGGVILPKPSEGFFVPAHLRILHVSEEALFFVGDLYENLVFGVQKNDPDGDRERVRSICKRLGLDPGLLTGIDDAVVPAQYLTTAAVTASYSGTEWLESLSSTQRSLFALVRSLVANPELMCIHKPTMAYDEKTSLLVLNILKDFVRSKGVEQDSSKRHLRRPRTCIMTSSKLLHVAYADKVYRVSIKDGVNEVENAKVNIGEHLLE